jgi:PPK2 family polyphosphate:nucleotide phosphotransferase
MNHDHFIVPPGKKIRLKDYDPGFTSHYKNRAEASAKLRKDIELLAKYHPQGTQVHSFKAPTEEELDHDFLWRSMKALPGRGEIGIFNRSYYEEVLVVRVHPEILDLQRLPPSAKGKGIWKRRFDEINHFEKYLVRNGIVVLKFFRNLSKGEQKRRLLARINTPEKNWKFSLADAKERDYWDDYMNAFEDTFNHTSTEHALWYIIPADNKWFTQTVVADVIIEKLKSLELRYPVVSEEQRQHFLEAKALLGK